MLSSRLIYSIRAYKEYGFNIFVNTEALNFYDKFVIDNFYVLTIIAYGFIIYLFLSVLNKYIANRADSFYKVIIIVTFLYLFSESLSFNGGLCIFIVLLGSLFYKDKLDSKGQLSHQDGGGADEKTFSK